MADLSEPTIIYYVQSNDNIWAVTADGRWLEITADSIMPGLMLYQVSSDDIQVDGDQLPSILIGGQSEALPFDIAVRIAPNLSGRFDSLQDPNSNQTSRPSQTSDSGDTTPDQQGVNLNFQLIANTENNLTPTSGFDTYGDSLDQQSEQAQNQGVEQDSFQTLELTVGILDGGDGYINHAETPVVDLMGQAIDARDGQQLLLTLTDIHGQQITLNVFVTGETWQVNDVDISILADGLITAIITAPAYPGIAHKGEDTSIKDTQASISVEIIDSDDVLNSAEMKTVDIRGRVNNVEDGQTVSVTITDSQGHTLTIETVVTAGTWLIPATDLSGFEDGSLLVSVEVSDVSGNTVNATTELPVDILADITIDIDSGHDTVINAREMLHTDISGTVTDVEDGQLVTVTVRDSLGGVLIFTTSVKDGQWNLDDTDLSSLVDGPLIFEAQVTDLAGNPVIASDEKYKETDATVTVQVIDADGVLNSFESGNALLAGLVHNVEDARPVFITVTDSQGNTLSFTSIVLNGLWQVSDADLSSLAEGTLILHAITSDFEGNIAVAEGSIVKDTLAGISIEILDNDSVINALELSGISAQGLVTNVEDGQIVTIIFSDGNGHSKTVTSIITDGTWSVTDVDLSGFDDGSLTASVQVSDQAGNPATATTDILVDILASVTISVDSGEDTVINATEMLSTNIYGYVTDIEDGQTVNISVRDINGKALSFSAIVIAGEWRIDGTDLSSLADGPLSFTAQTSDQAGNTTTSDIGAYKESQAAVTILALDLDGVLNSAESSQTILAGVVHNIEDGRPVNITVTDSLGVSLSFTATVVNGIWRVKDADLSSLADGQLSLFATSSDFEGNVAVANNTVDKDTQAEITIEIIDADNVLNAVEMTTVELKGTVTNVEDGQTVTVTLTDNLGHTRELTAIVVDGVWTLAEIDLSEFDDGSLVASASVSDLAGNSVSADTSSPVDILADINMHVDTGTDTVINATEMLNLDVSGTVTDVENWQQVTVTVTDQSGNSLDFITFVFAGKWKVNNADISSLEDGPLVFEATTFDQAGNPTSTVDEAYKETKAFISIYAIDGDGILNGIESSNTLLAGFVHNVEDGRPVLITVTDSLGTSLTFSTSVVNGIWRIKNADLSSLEDGELSLQADTSDFEGNFATGTNIVDKDTSPVEVTIEIIAGTDDTLNSFETPITSLRGQTLNIEDGQIVTISITDQNNRTMTFEAVVKDNLWQLDNLDLSLLADGPISATAIVSDTAGNTATSTDNKSKDITADIEFSPASEDQSINIFGSLFAFYSGDILDIEDGQTVTVTFTDSSNQELIFTTIIIDGKWQFSHLDLSALADGQISVTAETIDIFGNPASDTTSLHKDTQARVSIEIIDNDGVLNAQEMSSVQIRGTVNNIEDGRTVLVLLSDGTNTITATAIISGGTWQLTAQDLSGFLDGALTATVWARDAVGNFASDNTSLPIDILADITINVDTGQNVSDSIINAAEMNKVDISGTTSNIETNQTITVTVRDASFNELTFTTTVINGVWNINDADLSSLTDGPLTFEASASDLAGNLATSNTSVLKDSLADISIHIDSGNDELLSSSELGAVLISGTTTNIEAGRTVTVNLTDSAGNTLSFNTTVQAGGIWSIPLQDFIALGFVDGLFTVTASVTDLAGNPATASDTVTLDTQVTIDIDTGADGFNVALFMYGVQGSLAGMTTGVEQNQTVTLTVTDGVDTVSFTTLVNADGSWQFDTLDVSGLNKSNTWSMDVNVSDLAGNSAQDLMPTLDLPDTHFLFEIFLNLDPTTSTTVDFDIPDAALKMSADQARLLTMTSNTQALSINVASDGLSFTLTRDGDGKTVMTASLVGGALQVTLHQTIDELSGINTTTYIQLEALQTDTDGTTEQIITYAVLNIYDTPPLAVDDEISIIEDVISKGSLTGNDYTIEGPLVLTKISYNGTDYPISVGSPAVIITPQGTLTVQSNGSWQFIAADNLDNTQIQNFQFDYHVLDVDGSPSMATANFTLEDGAAGQMTDVVIFTQEADIDASLSQNENFTITGGSDALLTSSLAFSSLTPSHLDNQLFTSGGKLIKFELSADGQTLTAYTEGLPNITIFTLTLSSVNNGNDLDVTVIYDQFRPLDHDLEEILAIETQITATDSDGTQISLGDMQWHITDGNNPQLTNISQLTFAEDALVGPALQQTGQFDVLVGSDAIASVTFSDIGQQPDLTAGGQTIVYSLSADGLTLTAHTGDIANPVFVVVLTQTWHAETDSLSQDYTITLHRAFDQVGSENVDLTLTVMDFDGDSTQSTLTMTVNDASAATIDNISLSVSELPSVTAFDNDDSGLFNVNASKDPIVDVLFDVIDGAEVKNTDGTILTQNGEAIHWVIKDDGARVEGVTTSGELVFTISLPLNINIAAGSSDAIAIDFTLLGPIDHLGSADLMDTLAVNVKVIDSDNTTATGQVSIDIYDGKEAILPEPVALHMTEGNLTTSSVISTSEIMNTLSGGDDIASIELADGFTLGAYKSAGQDINFTGSPNGNGWYTATRDGDGQTVFQIRFGADGKVEYKQFLSLDHADANGENDLEIIFQVQAIDADGDKSANQTVTVTVTDDVPDATAKTLSFFESANEVHTVQMFSTSEQGADGASATKVIYKGVEYDIGVTIDLMTDANPTAVKYGEFVVDANGLATITSFEFVYADPQFSEVVSIRVTDADGDIVIDTLTITAKDQLGSVKVFTTDFVEDTTGTVAVQASPGDIDAGEVIISLVFDAAALQGGILSLEGAELPKDGAGNYILSGSDLHINSLTGVAIPSGNLTYTPAEDASDATVAASFDITVNIAGKGPITTSVPITIVSVADVPVWDNASIFNYSLDEDDSSITLTLDANSKDENGIDAQGSETISYIITGISSGLTLSSIGFPVTEGMLISQHQLDSLEAEIGANLAGSFTFNIQAMTTESDNGDTALGNVETVTFDVNPIADKPTLTTRDIRSEEDAPILLKDIISGELTDDSGSETLSYEFTLPDGWTLQGDSVIDLGGGVWTVLAIDVLSGNAKLLPAVDVSSANFGDFSITIRSFATESSQDGIDPKDKVLNPNPNYSDPDTITISLKGVANDAPTINADPTVWSIDNGTGVISSVVNFNEDQNIPLDFSIITSDDDGSETLDLRIAGLPQGVIFVDENGTPVNLPVVEFINGQPVYGVSAALLASLSLQPVEDFSGQISLTIFVESTELDGDSSDYELTLNIGIAPVIDANATSLATTSYGLEDHAIPLNLTPFMGADLDGSEMVTGLIIPLQGGSGFILTLDGTEVTIPISGLDVSTLLDSTSPDIESLLSSGRLAVVPPQDADGSFSFDIQYQITDTSETGESISEYVSTQVTVIVDAVVEANTHLQANHTSLISTDGNAIDLTNQVLFYDEDIDGSEVLDYVVIIVPSGDGWYISHPNGAINDGDGRWIIPVDGMTDDTTQEYALDILAGATIISEFATSLQLITVEARVLDRDDADIIRANFFVRFDQDAGTSTATVVDPLQTTPADAIEDNVIDFAGHLNLSITSDMNDQISFRVLVSDLPQGGYFTGADVRAVYDSSGEHVIEYVFTSASQANLQLHNISADYAGELNIPIRIIATDTISGDTKIDDTQVLEIEIAPRVDGASLTLANKTMLEDQPIPLGITLSLQDSDTSPTTGGNESLIFNDASKPISITFLDGGGLNDPSGLWVLKAGTTDTFLFGGNNLATLNASLALIQFVPPEHLSGDFRFKLAGSIIDTASINGSDVTHEASFENIATITVIPVTDAADMPTTTQTLTGLEDSDIDLSALAAGSIDLIDLDGSEVIFLTVQGVPEGAVLYYLDGGNLVQLPNNGVDGGSFDGSPTYSWSVTQAQLANLVMRPPQDFNGDIPLSLQAITQETGTTDFVTTSTDIIVGVSPVADGVQIIQAPDSFYSSLEDEIIVIDLEVEALELSGGEQLQLTITITSADASALVGLDGIRVGSDFVSFTDLGGGAFSASLLISASSLSEFELHPGNLAFGTLNVQMDITSVDSATVLGTNETDTSAPQTFNFVIEIEPEVDMPIWTQVGDIIANDPNDVSLNLGVELQNPAVTETGNVSIFGLPDTMTLSAGNKVGNKWIVSLDDLSDLKVIGAVDGDTFQLYLEPIAELDGDTALGTLRIITVTVDTTAVMMLSTPIANALNSPQDIIESQAAIEDSLLSSERYERINRHVDDEAPIYSVNSAAETNSNQALTDEAPLYSFNPDLNTDSNTDSKQTLDDEAPLYSVSSDLTTGSNTGSDAESKQTLDDEAPLYSVSSDTSTGSKLTLDDESPSYHASDSNQPAAEAELTQALLAESIRRSLSQDEAPLYHTSQNQPESNNIQTLPFADGASREALNNLQDEINLMSQLT